MSYLVDTNVFGEPARPKPHSQVVEWLRQHESELYVSTITIGELRRGIESLPAGSRKARLNAWLLSRCDCMRGRVLSFNVSTAHVWGQLKAKWDKEGVSIPSLDSQLVATAHRYNLTIVTRNTSDFQKSGIKLLDPFVM